MLKEASLKQLSSCKKRIFKQWPARNSKMLFQVNTRVKKKRKPCNTLHFPVIRWKCGSDSLKTMVLPNHNPTVHFASFEQLNRFLWLLNGPEAMFNPIVLPQSQADHPGRPRSCEQLWNAVERTLPSYCMGSSHSRDRLPVFYLQKCAGMGTLFEIFLLLLKRNGKQ